MSRRRPSPSRPEPVVERVALAEWPLEGLELLFGQDIAMLYREFASDDRRLAEEGMEDYGRLLAHADEE